MMDYTSAAISSERGVLGKVLKSLKFLLIEVFCQINQRWTYLMLKGISKGVSIIITKKRVWISVVSK